MLSLLYFQKFQKLISIYLNNIFIYNLCLDIDIFFYLYKLLISINFLIL